MSIKKMILSFCLILSPLLGEAVILQGDEISAIDPFVDRETLVVLDIDDTLIHSKTTLGNPACFYQLRDHFIQKEIFSEEETVNIFDHFDLLLQNHVEFDLVDEKIREMIYRYQDQGIDVIALTSRPMLLSTVTKNILTRLGIPLGSNNPVKQEQFTLNNPSLYDQGILFVGDQNKKSAVLDYYIHRISQKPMTYKRIIFVDDKEVYVKDLEQYAKENQIEFIGLYYTKEKSRQRNVDLSLALRQIRQLIGYSGQPAQDPSPGRSEMTDERFLHLLFQKTPEEGEYFYLDGNVIPDHFLGDFE